MYISYDTITLQSHACPSAFSPSVLVVDLFHILAYGDTRVVQPARDDEAYHL